LRADLVKSGDVFRAELAQIVPTRHAAYHAMSATATMYYYALQKFEADVFAEDEIEVADKACEDALGNALLADKADKDPFYDFWQSATLLRV